MRRIFSRQGTKYVSFMLIFALLFSIVPSKTAHAALSRTDHLNVMTVVGTGNAEPFTMTTSSFTPPSNSFLVLALGAVTNANIHAGTSNVTGGGLTWTRRLRTTDLVSGYYSIHEIWTAPVTTGASMTITITNTQNTGFDEARVTTQLVSFTGYDSASPIGATASGSDLGVGVATITLNATPSTDSVVWANRYYLDQDVLATTATPGSGWTEVFDLVGSGGNVGYGDMQSQYVTASTTQSVVWANFADNASANAHTSSGLALEIKAESAVPGPGTLECSITTAAACSSPSVIMLRMSSSTNAHAELASQSTAGYANNVICCSADTTIGNSCSGNHETILKLSATTNAHVEQNDQANYSESACLSGSGTITIGYQNTNCSGYDTTLASISSTTNAHIGGPSAYTRKVCGTVEASAAQSLSFSISDNTVGFGSLTSGAARYATGDGAGSSTETGAHDLIASSNASGGYIILVSGPTLTAGGTTITEIGNTNTASAPGTEQFGIRATASGGTGAVSSPYAASGFAYAGTSTQSQIASVATGDDVSTTYSVRYLANVTSNTESGEYASTITYTIVTNF